MPREIPKFCMIYYSAIFLWVGSVLSTDPAQRSVTVGKEPGDLSDLSDVSDLDTYLVHSSG